MATFSAPAGAVARASLSVRARASTRTNQSDRAPMMTTTEHVLDGVDEHGRPPRLAGMTSIDVDGEEGPDHIAPLCCRGTCAAHHAPASARKK